MMIRVLKVVGGREGNIRQVVRPRGKVPRGKFLPRVKQLVAAKLEIGFLRMGKSLIIGLGDAFGPFTGGLAVLTFSGEPGLPCRRVDNDCIPRQPGSCDMLTALPGRTLIRKRGDLLGPAR